MFKFFGKLFRLVFPIVASWYILKKRDDNNKWGATEEEYLSELPGDDLIPDQVREHTRAITIRASADKIWPWLVQMGRDKAGFYSYESIEKCFGLEIKTSTEIIPEFQNLKEGEWIAISEDGFGFEVNEMMENEYLVLLSRPSKITDGEGEIEEYSGWDNESSWAFILRKVDDNLSRLIIRTRIGKKDGVSDKLFYHFLLEPGHFIMERKMMLGIKERVERQR